MNKLKSRLKDPWSAITHGIAGALAVAGAAPLLIKAAQCQGMLLSTLLHLPVFILTMILLYTASTVYHSVDSTEKVNRRPSQNGSHDDLCYDRWQLYTCMPDCTS